MARYDTIGKHKTRIITENNGGWTSVAYHATTVVMFNDKQIILNHGGWLTNTTKVRMNQTSWEYNLGYSVFQKNFEWFVDFNGDTIPFDGDKVILERMILL